MASKAGPKGSAVITLPKKLVAVKEKEDITSIPQPAAAAAGSSGRGSPKQKQQPTENKEETNPLMIDLVLQNVMGMLEADELLECRRVCKAWNRHASEAFGKAGYWIQLEDGKQVATFSKDMTNAISFPYENISLGKTLSKTVARNITRIGTGIKQLRIDVEGGGRARGNINMSSLHIVLSATPNVRYLDLKNINFPRADYPTDTEYNPVVTLNSLKAIRFTHDFKDPFVWRNELEILHKLFRACPKLESFELEASPYIHPNVGNIDRFLEIIRNISTLTDFGISYQDIRRANLGLLLESTFRLTSFTISGSYSDNGLEIFLQRFLKRNAVTMEKLHVNFLPAAGLVNLSIPVMGKLKTMVLGGAIRPQAHGPAQINNLPSLRQLDLFQTSDQTLTWAFTQVPQLECLRLNSYLGPTELGTVLTGIPCVNWLQKALSGMVTAGVSEEYRQIYFHLSLLAAATEPSLCKMLNLKELELCSGRGNGQIDHSIVEFALLQMKPLDKLILTDINGIVRSGYEALKKVHRDVKIIINT